jgi:hypothetical protein
VGSIFIVILQSKQRRRPSPAHRPAAGYSAAQGARQGAGWGSPAAAAGKATQAPYGAPWAGLGSGSQAAGDQRAQGETDHDRADEVGQGQGDVVHINPNARWPSGHHGAQTQTAQRNRALRRHALA